MRYEERQAPPAFPTSPSFQNNQSFDNNRSRNGFTKSVVEYIFIAIVVFIIASLIFRKYRLSKLQDQRRAFDASSRGYRNFSPPVELQSYPDGQPYPPYPDQYLTGIPAAHMAQPHLSRRTHATDIDPGGRRLGDIPVGTDHDGRLDAKDDLPAYSKFGGPPRYLELDTHNQNQPPLGRTARTPNVGNINDPLPGSVGVPTSVPPTHRVYSGQSTQQ